jgi:hypothetical protein
MDKATLAPAPTADGVLPGWVVDRAAEYMVRRYGVAALKRAAARQRFLLGIGDDRAAAHWMRVAEAIAASIRRHAAVAEAL